MPARTMMVSTRHLVRRLCAVATQLTPSRGYSDAVPYTPRRAMLYVPGDDERKVRKVATLDVDSAVMDCEDGVAINRKVICRWAGRMS